MNKARVIGGELLRLIRLIPWALRLMWSSHRVAVVVIGILTVAQAFVPVIQLWITKLLVDQVVVVINLPAKMRQGDPLQQVYYYLAAEAALMGLGLLLSIASGHVRNILQENLVYNVQLMTLEKAAEMDLAMYESAAYYDQFRRAHSEAMYGPIQLLFALLDFAQSLLTLLTVTGIVLLYKAWIAPLLILVTIPGFIVGLYYGNRRFVLFNDRAPDGRRAEYLGNVLATDTYAKELRVWGITEHIMREIRALRGRFRHENIDISRRQSIGGLAGAVLSALGYYGAYLTVILGVVAGRLTLGDLSMYAGAFSQAQALFERALTALVNVYQTQLFAENLSIFMALESEVVAPENPQPVPDLHEQITFENVSFTYPETDRVVLKNVSFTIKKGECVALVGSNGAGKTTLIKLLLRLYNVDSGAITADGVDLAMVDPWEWRKKTGVIFQDYARYQLTAQENVGFGCIEALDDLVAIREAAKKGGIDHILNELPQGYDTILGRQFADGSELSLGQWQRVALARALLRDAPLLIMDEPTAAMDAQAEYELYQQLQQLAKGRMSLIISHRFSTVRMADRILVMEHGEIIEEGNHDTLMALNGRYSELFRRQAESYQLDDENTPHLNGVNGVAPTVSV